MNSVLHTIDDASSRSTPVMMEYLLENGMTFGEPAFL